MTNNIIIVFVSFILLVSGCQKKNKQYSNLNMFPKDHHSFADPIKAVINNLELDLEVNFEISILLEQQK